jgi:hypothetical protein
VASAVTMPVPACVGPATNPPIKHVFLIVLENKSYENTFGKASHSKLKDLSAEGRLLTNYWGIGHNSLDNYIAMVSGQAPNPITQMDCPIFLDFVGTPKIERMKRTLTVFGESTLRTITTNSRGLDAFTPSRFLRSPINLNRTTLRGAHICRI